MIHFTVTCVNTMSRYFYLVFLLISIHNSFCNIEDHNEYRELIRSSRQTAYKPRRHIRRSNKAHHQGFRRIRADKDAGEINDLLQEIDVASFMQSPDYEYVTFIIIYYRYSHPICQDPFCIVSTYFSFVCRNSGYRDYNNLA